ncbi:MAG: SGNH/GDSL hydrolase family protein [Planctomycetota bacterium]|jgi:lysophospholipase L1-like esterase|nr:SGNH/GDSL hydrolase family protein [Planctomycetota bacterium]
MGEGRKVVLCYGDSNTWGQRPGMEMRRWPSGTRWPGVMAGELGAGYRIIEEGLCGRTSAFPDPLEPAGVNRNGLATLGAILDSHKPLDLVIIALGVNDLKARFSLPPQDIAAGVELLVLAAANPRFGSEDALRPPAVLIVCPPEVLEIPAAFGPMFRGAAETSKALRPCFRQMAARNKAAIMYAGDLVRSDPLDGIHWSAESHAALGRAAAKRVVEILG